MSFRASLLLSLCRALFNRLQSFSYSKNNKTANCFINLSAEWVGKWAEYLIFSARRWHFFLFNFSSHTSIPFLPSFSPRLGFRFSLMIFRFHASPSQTVFSASWESFLWHSFYGFPSQIASILNRLIIEWVVSVRVAAVALETKRVPERKQVIIYGRENILKAPRKNSIKLVTSL